MSEFCSIRSKCQNRLSKRGSSETPYGTRNESEPNTFRKIPATFWHHLQHKPTRQGATPAVPPPIRDGSVLLFANQMSHTFPIRSQTRHKSILCGSAGIMRAHAVGRGHGARGCSTAKISPLGNHVFADSQSQCAIFGEHAEMCCPATKAAPAHIWRLSL
ncbi:hypothetical protein KL938_004521 [Ogataea parapolymorpha]|nr:hypothetical protein KL938_004521 [Ogataea parapolymorpha]